ncbi:hypothetical protein F2Z85_04055 [Bacteroides fragilis]|uniref:Uncharacterized protein n=1 Tax=Bacteroides fragilis TaxID=817 RepID=A0A5M5UFP2_BACFG|nr:hypothetical protein F2841_12240 [Bacteroides fragilis]MZH34644.1 hypothetical protein [Enterococcus durans]KAA4781109.1 hypothetical protein F3B22_09230 [Bacteroides fragilis]KAA4789447.1 hypothetical protein F3B20_07185 [Bacteroides fragilis]KAA4794018.1 hypothetical protein F3B21_05515 [Bacteroides fragilis]
MIGVGQWSYPYFLSPFRPYKNKGRNSHSTLYQSKLQSKNELYHDRTTHSFIVIQVMCQKHNFLIIKDFKKKKDVQQRTPHLHLRTL